MIVLVTVSIVSLIFDIRSAMSNGSRLRIVPSSGTTGDCSGSRIDLHELVADETVVLNRRDGVEAEELMQVAPDAHPHAKLACWRSRHPNRLDFAGVHAATR